MRQTHTYAILELTGAAFHEISEKLKAAGYDHAFQNGVIDMHGIAVQYDGNGPAPGYRYSEQDCTGHIASATNAKVCAHCGIHIDSLRPPEYNDGDM